MTIDEMIESAREGAALHKPDRGSAWKWGRLLGEMADSIERVLVMHSPIRNYTSGSTDPNHVPSFETRCRKCGELYPCSTVTACESAGTSDADH